MLTHWAVQLMGKVFFLNVCRTSASSAFCKGTVVTTWKELVETDSLETWQLFGFSRVTRSQQTILILYSNPNESHPKASAFRMFEEDLQHTQILRICVGIP